jgi:hypothetical protein
MFVDGVACADHDQRRWQRVAVRSISFAIVTGLLSGPARERLSTCGAKEVVVTNTLPIPEDKRFPQLTVLSIAPLLARTIHEVFVDGTTAAAQSSDVSGYRLAMSTATEEPPNNCAARSMSLIRPISGWVTDRGERPSIHRRAARYQTTRA